MTNFLKSILTPFIKPKIDLNGKWKGSYNYGKGYPIEMKDKSVTFTANLFSKTDHFTGTSQEDENGIIDEAKINGTLTNRKISFIKTYPKAYLLNMENNIKTHENFGQQIVHYSGKYIDEEQRFVGNWEIHMTIIHPDGKEDKHFSSGKWEMKKNGLSEVYLRGRNYQLSRICNP